MASWGKGFLFYKVCILYVRPIFHFLKSKFTQSLLFTDFTKCTHSVSQSRLYTTTIYIWGFEWSFGRAWSGSFCCSFIQFLGLCRLKTSPRCKTRRGHVHWHALTHYAFNRISCQNMNMSTQQCGNTNDWSKRWQDSIWEYFSVWLLLNSWETF